ncbi:flagellar M-ring protein FliF [Anoxybacter fermentans]|uniref:Flagellar M-ring protein n=1 Tax=Anoxybacter fermentans TaxID=1323375 RepID=A0A3S9SZZ7_9FIRM|nr:flagellar basal-body MS-ring/collar protein FliF [Anoxybacter fermentans]AZR73881.1 flagellar M-ring protein FliF [Anoxybacter fermentans]
MEWLKQLIDQFLNLWKKLDIQKRLLLGTVIFAVILGLIFLVNWAGKPQYDVLYSNLNEKEASSITNWLKEKGILYKLEAGGSRILVPRDKKYDIRLELAGEGLSPRGGSVGFEIFDQPRFGMTDKERRIQYIRAIAGEMERSIELIDGVEYAKVKISLPEPSLFVEEEKPATASVILKISPGVRLSQKNIIAITHLLAGGVEGLTPDNVTVVDTLGNIYTQTFQSEDEFDQITSNQLQIQKNIEEKIRRNLEYLLGKLYGPNNIAVAVTAEINFDKKEIYDIIYSPVVGDEGIVRSSQTYEEEYQGNGTYPVGVPGSESNIPQYQGTDATNNSNYSKEESTINYELNERRVQQLVANNVIKKLSVSVVINREIDQTEEERIQNLVGAAIGYDETRGDKLTVLGMPFDNSLEKELMEAVKLRQASETRQMVIYGVAGLIGFIVLWIIIRRTRKNAAQQSGRVNVLIGDEAEKEMAATLTHELTPEEKARQEIRKEIADLISKRPEDVAQLLKTWLMED